MTFEEFRRAFISLRLAIENNSDKKPKSIIHATRGYRSHGNAKLAVIKELETMTLMELFDLSYKLKAEERANASNQETKRQEG